MLIPFIRLQAQQQMSQKRNARSLCLYTLIVQTQYQFLFVHIAAEMCQNLKPIFENK